MKEYEATEIAYKKGYKQGRAEAIKEFMQRASEKAFHDMNDGESIVCCCDLDQITKEMGCGE